MAAVARAAKTITAPAAHHQVSRADETIRAPGPGLLLVAVVRTTLAAVAARATRSGWADTTHTESGAGTEAPLPRAYATRVGRSAAMPRAAVTPGMVSTTPATTTVPWKPDSGRSRSNVSPVLAWTNAAVADVMTTGSLLGVRPTTVPPLLLSSTSSMSYVFAPGSPRTLIVASPATPVASAWSASSRQPRAVRGTVTVRCAGSAPGPRTSPIGRTAICPALSTSQIVVLTSPVIGAPLTVTVTSIRPGLIGTPRRPAPRADTMRAVSLLTRGPCATSAIPRLDARKETSSWPWSTRPATDTTAAASRPSPMSGDVVDSTPTSAVGSTARSRRVSAPLRTLADVASRDACVASTVETRIANPTARDVSAIVTPKVDNRRAS